MAEKLLSTSDTKLIQYLNEAFGKEKELETALQAHIKMASGRATYKKRLQEHLKETKAQARNLERRIKKIGGKAEWVSLPGPEVAAEVASKATAAATKAIARGQGPRAHAARHRRGREAAQERQDRALERVRGDRQLHRDRDARRRRVGDKETEKLARDHRKQEERMAAFLQKLMPQLAKAVVTEEIPAVRAPQARRAVAARARAPTRRRLARSRPRHARSPRRRARSRPPRAPSRRRAARRAGAARAPQPGRPDLAAPLSGVAAAGR